MFLARLSCSMCCVIQCLLSSGDFKCNDLEQFPDSAFSSLSLWYCNFGYPAGLLIMTGLKHLAICWKERLLAWRCLSTWKLFNVETFALADKTDTASAYWFCTAACLIKPCPILVLIWGPPSVLNLIYGNTNIAVKVNINKRKNILIWTKFIHFWIHDYRFILDWKHTLTPHHTKLQAHDVTDDINGRFQIQISYFSIDTSQSPSGGVAIPDCAYLKFSLQSIKSTHHVSNIVS